LPNSTPRPESAPPTPNTAIAGVILAAGESRRMGRDKALLPVGQETFLEHLIQVLRREVSPLVIVLGHHADEIERHIVAAGVLKQPETIVLRNPDYAQGQLSSLKVALRYLIAGPASAAVVALVDHPASTPETIRLLLSRFQQGGAPILIPTCLGRRGHPVLFARRLFRELLDAPLEQGARFVVHQHSGEVELVETQDESVLWDIDYPADYERLLARLKLGAQQ
jgi:molybdenum cofactor cytidylyltransferase